MKMKKIFSGLITTVLFLTLIFMVFIVISSKASGGEPNVFGYQIKTVLSGSMEPTFKTGSIIAIKPQEDNNQFEKGDIITFKLNEYNIVTHRITNVVIKGGLVMYETKGDNNEDPDSNLQLPENVVGKYTGFTIPYVGYLINFAKSKVGSSLLLIVPGVLLLVYSFVSIYKALKEIENTAGNKKTDSFERSI